MKKAFIPLLFLLILLASCSAPDEKLTKDTKIFKEGVINADYQVPKNLAELESNREFQIRCDNRHFRTLAFKHRRIPSCGKLHCT